MDILTIAQQTDYSPVFTTANQWIRKAYGAQPATMPLTDDLEALEESVLVEIYGVYSACVTAIVTDAGFQSIGYASTAHYAYARICKMWQDEIDMLRAFKRLYVRFYSLSWYEDALQSLEYRTAALEMQITIEGQKS